MSDQQSGSLRARPRKSEKIAWILFAIVLALFIIFEIAGRYQLDATQGLLILLVVVLILFVVLREKPSWNMHDAIEHVRRERWKYHHEYLDPDKGEVQPAGRNWIVDFAGDARAFTVDPLKHRTIGLRVKTADEMLKQVERSEILKSAMKQEIKDQQTEEALSALGFDTEKTDEPEEEE